MPGYRTQVLVNFVVRAVIGTALIFFVNQFLNARGIDIRVGMNPVTVVTSGVLGTPGVALLYGFLFIEDSERSRRHCRNIYPEPEVPEPARADIL